jgi:hypothetical protein
LPGISHTGTVEWFKQLPEVLVGLRRAGVDQIAGQQHTQRRRLQAVDALHRHAQRGSGVHPLVEQAPGGQYVGVG